jgi:UDP-N-acetylglucosamine--N-acetylmuramyl-(pentapeptide) pyrophosphoryl-undecaprenol N-acetylglucosamine transferase
MLPLLKKLPEVHFVFVTGERFYKDAEDAVRRELREGTDRVKVLPYIGNMPDVLAASSLYVGRAGASFLAEVTSLGLPSLLVPSPNVTNNHQEANARSLMNAGAANMILERELSGEALYAGIDSIMGDRTRRDAMSESSRNLGMPESAAIIYEQIVGLQRKR